MEPGELAIGEGAVTANADVDVGSDEIDSKECYLRRYFLLEWDDLLTRLHRLAAGDCCPSNVNHIRSIMDKYQEEGQLLEPYLESIVPPLMSLVRDKALLLNGDGRANAEEAFNTIKPLCIVVYTTVTVCGYKSVVRFFPHCVADLEIAVGLLERCRGMRAVTALRQESTGEMETACVVLLWLYILVLIPFDIATVDSTIADGVNVDDLEAVPLVTKILDTCKNYLTSSAPMRWISGLLLARLLTRPDMVKAFNSFMDWVHNALSSITDEFMDHFRSIGLMEALASVFKIGTRKALNGVAIATWSDCSIIMKTTVAAQSSLLRKNVVKLSQRVALVCLQPRSQSWQYQSEKSVLGNNLPSLPPGYGNLEECGHLNQKIDESSTEEDIDVPEIVEEIIDLLLTGLRDSDTIVRWSAAKGIGRITARLPPSLSEEVLSSILQLFSTGEGDGSWHGGCLALAELARRGLLLPTSFPEVVPVIIKALHYDVRRGPHSIGSHVRDAAAYVCWAFGRAYSRSDMRDVFTDLAPHLLIVACYDREVNCRRAASAAFQENVGRQGTYPHGIDIVNMADYFALSSRSNTYLNVATSIAQHKEYLCPFVDELLLNKISHWEKSLRELASQALSALVQYDPEYFAEHVLEKIIPCTLSADLCTRHGATLAAAEVTLKLHQIGFTLNADKQKALSGVVPAIEKARLYRGKGGEIMRSAVSRLIACISLSRLYLNERVKKNLLDTINENLKHPNPRIQCAAVEALKYFIPAYLVHGDKFLDDVSKKYLELLNDSNVAARRGSALALGVLPPECLSKRWVSVIDKLCCACTIEHNPDDPDAEARVNAVRGLVSVCETLTAWVDWVSSEKDSLLVYMRDRVMRTLLKALDDYAVDNRGDVGSWVREAAMDALERCTYMLCKGDLVADPSNAPTNENKAVPLCDDTTALKSSHTLFDAELAQLLVEGIVKQAVEKMDKLREKAIKVIQRILYSEIQFVPFIPHREMLETIITNNYELDWAVPTVSYPRLVKLLRLSSFRRAVLSGLVISTGGLLESLRKVSLAALIEYLEDVDSEDDTRNSRELLLSSDFLWLLQKYQKCERVTTPALKTIEVLLSKKFFLEMEGHTDEFCSVLVDLVSIELKGSKDFAKLGAGLSILGYLSSHSISSSTSAFLHLLSFLGHRYPKIRKAAAEQVYLALLAKNDLMFEDNIGKALELLSETCWEGDLEAAKEKRLLLKEMAVSKVSIACASTNCASTNQETSNAKRATEAADENKSYSSLVGSSGF